MGKVNVSGQLSNVALTAFESFRRSWNLKDISFNNLDSVYFRKTRLKVCIQKMLDAINGRTIEFRVLTTDFYGSFIEKSVHDLVRDLMDSLVFYIRYKQSEGPYGDNSILSREMDVLSPKRVSFFYSFLYLAVIHFMYTDAELSDLIDFASNIPVYRSYREFLSFYFEQNYLPMPAAGSITRENGQYSIGSQLMNEPDLFEVNARSFTARRSCWLETVRNTQAAYYGLPGEPQSGNRIMQFRCLTHASDDDIAQMIADLEDRNLCVPKQWISEYDEIKESYKDADLTSAVDPLGWEKELLEKSITEFLHMQQYAHSSEVFTDAIAGMVDVYTVRGGGMAISDPDSFYKIFDNLEKIERYSRDHMLPYKKEAL